MDMNNLIQGLKDSFQIDKKLYDDFNVKRGLRNNDGSGVLVGLTRIGNVHGYIRDEQEIVPVEGKLSYRGIDVQSIVKHLEKENRFGFEEVIFLLLFGKLPSESELKNFNELLDSKRALPDGFTENMILKSPSSDIMNNLARCILALYSYDNNPDDISIENVLNQSIELIARFPTLIAYGYQAKERYYNNGSLFLHNPIDNQGTAKCFLQLIRSDQKFTELEAKTLDICLVLHAEHGGGNNSSFAIHVITSTDTDTYSAISGAVGSLKGPKHGGANSKVMSMMDNIKNHLTNWEDEKEVADYLVKILKKQAFDHTGLIYGVGHAVYTLSDPRAVILKHYARELAIEKHREKEFRLYDTIERLAPILFQEVKKSDKKICVNVDFYSGFVYNMLNLTPDLYTPIFAMSRISGWCAHRLEELISGGRIIRPAYKSVEHNEEYVPLKMRK
ncbi:MAG: citrate/2-methylcitrate synthase [Bacteroidota bacterium]|nr:citrate/2-methylcitrate synthase [Bacteroidota bacterium]MDP4274225.1 citrate/2-methylcitrate synthase [Bacteroidota bacterium]